MGIMGDHMCSDQMDVCGALCGGKAKTNTCASNNEGYDNAFQSYTYCFSCMCENGRYPEDWSSYQDTVDTVSCRRARQTAETIGVNSARPPRDRQTRHRLRLCRDLVGLRYQRRRDEIYQGRRASPYFWGGT
ncbi:hypothetical protein B0T26DRAFT_672448 [Lasiosphaeria miniovina]|uniref:DUF7707 domain-containing protein n=1 Tax=Lasiosphaeria miniovina TaxID=1954250 RepID=A0AA40B535_9PEZI|nr:uncharacterized protein B0T26DRAFT_672448 [Lasiosphaeria miniovina]KAK0727830.1 hypothetical protein B0T26DRAFT_672448 [Lasiosphaeria miniovina]